MFVFIIGQDWTIRNMVEQVGLTCGYPSIGVETLPEAESRLAQLGPKAVALIVIDTSVLGGERTDVQRNMRHLRQTWASLYSGLPVICLGTVLQKYACLAAESRYVPFVTLPVSPHDLMATVQPFLPQDNQWLRMPSPSNAVYRQIEC